MMPKLYTSLVRAKQEMNGGDLPEMTPVPERFHDVIDPEFTIGWGALREDADKGLQCPVRGCGKWYTALTQHLDKAHGDIGGSSRVRRAMDIPDSVGLWPRSHKEKQSEVMTRVNSEYEDRCDPRKNGSLEATRSIDRAASGKKYRRTIGSMAIRNMRGVCEDQIGQRLTLLQVELGRSPSKKEAKMMGEGDLVRACERVYGSWNAAKRQHDLKVYEDPGSSEARQYGKDGVLAAMEEWYDAHGDLPTLRQAKRPKRTPLIPAHNTILKYFGPGWKNAMRKIAFLIGADESRYRGAA